MMRWVKTGDFSVVQTNSDRKRKVEYTHPAHPHYQQRAEGKPTIQVIKIFQNPAGKIHFYIVTYDASLFSDCQKRGYVHKHSEMNLIWFTTPLMDKLETARDFLSVLQPHEPLFDDLAQELADALSLLRLEGDVTAEVLALANNNDFAEALEMAAEAQTQYHYFVPIWELAIYLDAKYQQWENVPKGERLTLRNSLYETLDKVAETSPFFIEANQRKMDLIAGMIISGRDEKIAITERQLSIAMSTKDYKLAALLFRELSGGKGLTTDVQEIKAHPSTLIQIAEEMRTMREELEELRAYKAKEEARKAAKAQCRLMTPQHTVPVVTPTLTTPKP